MKILSVVSARPNFVKLASIVHAVKKFPEIEHVIVHTGQHYDPLLSSMFFKQLEIDDSDTNLGVKGSSNRDQVIEDTAAAIEPILAEKRPNIVLVYGDVNGAVGAAKAAKKLGIQLAHVEAGLRSGDVDMPEEHNRIAVDQIADFLFCTEKSGVDHLQKEQVKGSIHLVGNTMIDTLIRMEKFIDMEPLEIALRKGTPFVIATLHRPSNVDSDTSLGTCVGLLRQVADYIPVYLPAHPRLKQSLERYGYLSHFGKKLFLTPPKSYFSFLHHLNVARFVITDSGGIQEEATFLKKRCFTLRKNTERPSTIESGSNVLIDIDKEEDRNKVLDFAKNPKDPQVTIPPLWDGKAGERIIEILRAL